VSAETEPTDRAVLLLRRTRELLLDCRAPAEQLGEPPAGQEPPTAFLFHVLGAIAEFERSLIRDRVVGLRRAQERGTRSGRPIGRPLRLLDGQDIRRRRAAGEPWRKIAKALKAPVRTFGRTVQSRSL